MPHKIITKSSKTPKTTAGAKSNSLPVNVVSITSGIQGITMTKGAKTPAFTSFLTIVQDHIMIRTIFIDCEQCVEFDLSLAAALVCGDGIEAVLASDGMGISLQREVYSFFIQTGAFGRTWTRSTTRTVIASQLIAKYVTNSRRRSVR